MMKSSTITYVTIFTLAILILATLGINLKLAGMTIDKTPIQPGEGAISILSDTNAPITSEHAERKGVSQALMRPVFSPSRRPFVEIAAPPVPITTDIVPVSIEDESRLDNLKLLGVRMINLEHQALIEITGEEPIHWYSVEDEIVGAKITAIDPNNVIIEISDKNYSLHLYNDPASSSPNE